jgi:ParB family chromosome partitioning protein
MRGLEELAENIRNYGVIQPIIVRPKGDKFEVVIGERRLRAAIMAGLEEVPAIIRDISDREADELRLIENIHRDDLTDAEMGDAVYALIELYPDKYPTIASVAKAINKPYNTVLSWTTQARKLSPHVRELFSNLKIKEGHVMYLLKYDHATQDKLADTIVKNELPVTAMPNFIKLYDENPKANLDELANKAKGIKKVTIELEKLPLKVKEEVEKIIEKKEQETKEKRRKAAEKAWEARRMREAKSMPKSILVDEKLSAFLTREPEKAPPVEVRSGPSVEVKPKPLEEELIDFLKSTLEKLRTEPFATREEAFKRIKKVLEEPLPSSREKERRMVKEIDTGIVITQVCPECHKELKYRLIHYEPSNGHGLEEVQE